MTHETMLVNWQQAHGVLTSLSRWLKPRLMAGHRVKLSVGEPTRSSEQNAKLHAMLTEIAKQVEWAGKKRSVDIWKRLVVASWLRAEGEAVEYLPALDGHGVDIIFERTSRMSKAQLSGLIEYMHAWGAENNVVWSDKPLA